MSSDPAAQPPKYYVTTPIYYVNARPHIGHAYTTIVADVLARRHRLLGEDTFFLTGTDEHGQKIERSALAKGMPPQQFADEVAASFEGLWKRMGITNDAFIRTTSEPHKRGVQQLFNTLYERGFIYLDSYTGAYCVSDEAFVDVPVGQPCPDCGRLTEEVTEENFFFRLSAFQRPLLDLIESGTLKIEPEARRNEVLSFLRGGLRDLSISRSSFTWGVPVPEPAASLTKEPHVIYVWLDALANYMTAVGYGAESDPTLSEEARARAQAEFGKWWPADLHLVGKEIIRFHCVYWPAFLLASGLPLPKTITAHGWLLFDNSKMSKSKGNIVRTETLLDAFGTLCPPLPVTSANLSSSSANLSFRSEAEESASPAPQAETRSPTPHERDLFASDVLRYFLLREIPFGQDGSFSFEAMVTRYNADLVNDYGNVVSRTFNLLLQNFTDGIPLPQKPWRCIDRQSAFEDEIPQTISEAYSGTAAVVRQLSSLESEFAGLIALQKWQVALAQLYLRITTVNGYISFHKPWTLAKSIDHEDRAKLVEILYTAAESIRIITALLYPILPFATARVWAQLGLGDIEVAAANGDLNNLQWGGLKPGTKLGPLSPIFPRADKSLIQIMTDMENEKPSTPPSADTRSDTHSVDPLKAALTPTPAAPVATSTTDPAAPPRSSNPLDEPAGTLPVAGSLAEKPTLPSTPGPATEAPASGAFGGSASQTSVDAQPSDASPQITIDDFAKVELRVAQIVVAERIPKADKLLRLEVDLGYEKRQILSGIAEWYTPEELVGRRIVVITNLAPRKMRGLESHGMLLAASDGPDNDGKPGKPVLATFGEDIALGSRLK